MEERESSLTYISPHSPEWREELLGLRRDLDTLELTHEQYTSSISLNERIKRKYLEVTDVEKENEIYSFSILTSFFLFVALGFVFFFEPSVRPKFSHDEVDLKRFEVVIPQSLNKTYNNVRMYKNDWGFGTEVRSGTLRDFYYQVGPINFYRLVKDESKDGRAIGVNLGLNTLSEDYHFLLAQTALIASNGQESFSSDETLIRWLGTRDLPIQTSILFAHQLKDNYPELAYEIGNHPSATKYLDAVLAAQRRDSLKGWFLILAIILWTASMFGVKYFFIDSRHNKIEILYNEAESYKPLTNQENPRIFQNV